MPARKTVTLYVVQSQPWSYNRAWIEAPPDDLRFDDDFDPSLSYGEEGLPVPMRPFLNQQTAEQYRQQLERRERKGLNPLHYGQGQGLDGFSSLSPAEFVGRLEQAGLEPPPLRRGQVDPRLWEWLYDGIETWSDEERDAVWDVCDKIRFFKVVSVRVELQTGSDKVEDV
jgi:hypothetical protein